MLSSNKIPKRGHHIINGDVPKIFAKIIDEFLRAIHDSDSEPDSYKKMQGFGRKLVPYSCLYQAYYGPMPKDKIEEIENFTVFFEHDNNENAVIYSPAVTTLEKKVVSRMLSLYQEKLKSVKKTLEVEDSKHRKETHEGEDSKDSLDLYKCIEDFINNKIYVDQVALDRWLNEEPKQKKQRERTYAEINKEVEKMLKKLSPGLNESGIDEVRQWVNDVWIAKNTTENKIKATFAIVHSVNEGPIKGLCWDENMQVFKFSSDYTMWTEWDIQPSDMINRFEIVHSSKRELLGIKHGTLTLTSNKGEADTLWYLPGIKLTSGKRLVSGKTHIHTDKSCINISEKDDCPIISTKRNTKFDLI